MMTLGINLIILGWLVIVAFGLRGERTNGDIFGAALIGAGVSTCLHAIVGMMP